MSAAAIPGVGASDADAEQDRQHGVHDEATPTLAEPSVMALSPCAIVDIIKIGILAGISMLVANHMLSTRNADDQREPE